MCFNPLSKRRCWTSGPSDFASVAWTQHEGVHIVLARSGQTCSPPSLLPPSRKASDFGLLNRHHYTTPPTVTSQPFTFRFFKRLRNNMSFATHAKCARNKVQHKSFASKKVPNGSRVSASLSVLLGEVAAFGLVLHDCNNDGVDDGFSFPLSRILRTMLLLP